MGRHLLPGVMLVTVSVAAAQGPFRWTDENGALKLSWDGKPLLQYNYDLVQPPEGVGAAFARNAYMHPVWNLAGQVVTGDFPADHRHQRGIFFAWTKTEFGDLHPDFWNLGSLTGRIRFEAVEERAAAADGATLVTRHIWEARRGEEWEPVLRECWRVKVYPPAANADSWQMDLTSEQELATPTSLVLPEYTYGGMAYRGPEDWVAKPEAVIVLTSEGKDRLGADASTARWCMMGGQLGEGWGGATLMDHPSNVRHPNPLRVHPKVPYFGFMLPKSGAYTVEPGKKLVLRYRIVVHSRLPEAAVLDRVWEDFRAASEP